MNILIIHTQTAYIKGRYILDNVALHSFRIKKIQSFLFKINFEKVFDKLNWDFLLENLEGRNFSIRWNYWIKDLLYSSEL
jgi:hypothetical protein